MRVLFAGTPEVAVPSLQAICESDHEVVGVLTMPDRRQGRGRKVSSSPVKQYALDAGLAVWQPDDINSESSREQLASFAPEVAAVVAYGALLRAPVLQMLEHGWINLHFSLLPAWRGAAPVQHAIASGDDVTGTTTFRIDEGLDTGEMFGHTTYPVRPGVTSGEALTELAADGAGLLVRTLDALAEGSAEPTPQPSQGVTYAPRITTADAQIAWDRPAYIIERHIRAMNPAPGAWTTCAGARMKIHAASASAEDIGDVPGMLRVQGQQVLVATASGTIELHQVQPAGKKPMDAADWVRGFCSTSCLLGEPVTA